MLKSLPFLALLLTITVFSKAQICTGNLGNNIFKNGDFGEGTSNLIRVDPAIAPGYVYDTRVPPDDGDYVITNNTAEWTGLYPSWLAIPDNSTNPFGYMMVVNASFEAGLFYEETIEGLCENTTYEFSADMINLIQQQVRGHIEPNVSFLLDGGVVLSTGNIPQDETWHTYGLTFDTGPGQTSLVLSLRNNAPGGIGNDLALDNISFRACGPKTQLIINDLASDSICDEGQELSLLADIIGDQFDTPVLQWQQSTDGGITWQNIDGETDTVLVTTPEAGLISYRFIVANSPSNLENPLCRSNSEARVLLIVPTTSAFNKVICEGESFSFGGNVLTQTGVYVDSLVNQLGCDSLVTLNLKIEPLVNTKPEVSLSLNTTDTLYCDTLYLGQSLSFVVNGFDVNNDFLTLNSEGRGIDLSDYRLDIADVTGIGSISETLTLSFECDVTSFPNPNLIEETLIIDFILTDSVICSVKERDTVSMKLVLIKESIPNEPPTIRTDLPNFDATTQSYFITATVGELINFNVFAEDVDLQDIITLSAKGEGVELAAIDVEFSDLSGVSPLQNTANWLIDCSHLMAGDRYRIQFIAQNDVDACGNQLGDTTWVEIMIQDIEAGAFNAPNAFSPNGDGIGDVYFIDQLPLDNCADQFKSIRIYNRWGKQVFYTKNRNFRWSGAGLPTGVYYCEVAYVNNLYKVAIHIF